MTELVLPIEDDYSKPRRLHPLTLVYRLLVSLPGLLFLLLPAMRQDADRQSIFSLVMAVLYGVLTLPWIFLYYYRFTFLITHREVTIHSGIVTRQRRSIPLERIQNVEVEQRLLQRLLGIARVRISTAGSAGAEGVLESVSLRDARQIKEVIRRRQQVLEVGSPGLPAEETTEVERVENVLFSMSGGQVLQAGAFRFSLFYIVLIFSGMQYLDIDPERVVDWIMIARPLEAFQAENEVPTWILALFGLGLAALVAWLTSMALAFNRYYGFRLWQEEDKLFKRHGLLTLTEDTIPLKRLQLLLFRANPAMRYFDRFSLEMQTMGVQTNQQGRKVVAPMAYRSRALALGQRLYPFSFPDTLHPVSRLTIRRAFIRYIVGWAILTGVGAYFWPTRLWGWMVLLLPLLWYLAVQRYRLHGFAIDDEVLYLRRGVWRHAMWVIPLSKVQSVFTASTIFQRRLGLKTLYIDTAGASGFYGAYIIDLPSEEAEAWMKTIYERFQATFSKLGRKKEIGTQGA